MLPQTNNQASIPTRVDPPATDLAVQVSAPETVTAGETVTYSLTASDLGRSPVQGVVLTDSTPGIVTALAVIPSSVACKANGNLLQCAIGTLTPQTPVVVTVSRPVPCDHPVGPLGGTASVHGDPAACDLQNNDSATIPTQVAVRADYAIEKTGPSEAFAGSVICYTITATNLGPSCPPGVLVSDAFPRELTEPQWCMGTSCPPDRSGDLAATLGLPVLGTATYLAHAVAPSTFTGTVVNTACVQAPPGIDPNVGNACSTVETRVVPAPPFEPGPPGIPTLPAAGLVVFAFLLVLVPLARLRRRASL